MTNDEPPPEKIRHQSRDLVGEVIKVGLRVIEKHALKTIYENYAALQLV